MPTKKSSIATVAFGLVILAIGKALSHASSEKYKARRGLPSVYPSYQCSWANVCCIFLFSIVLFITSLQFLLLVLWIAASGSRVFQIWHQEHRMDRKRIQSTEPWEEDLRTSEGWFFRSLPYHAIKLICLFALLVIASIIPAPIFISLELVPVFAP